MPHSTESQSIMSRYADAYLVARVTNGWGGLVKGIGIVIAILLALVGVAFLSEGRLGDATFAFGMVIIFSGVVSGGGFYVGGILLSAQGQMLKASLDSAVNSSPFLTNEERAIVMALPISPNSPHAFSAEEQGRGFALKFDGDEATASFTQPLDYVLDAVIEATKKVIREAFKDAADSPTPIQWMHQGRSVKALKLSGINQDYVSVVQVGESRKIQAIVVSKVEKGSLN